jgi:NAD+ synthase (glutamine-hydrolysing)
VSYLEDYQRNPEDILRAYQAGTLKTDLGLSQDIVGPGGYFLTISEFITHLEATWRRHHISVFKGIQSPPNIKVSRRARGYDHRESQIGWQPTRRYQALTKEILTSESSL